MRSNCRTRSDWPANFPADFTSTMCPSTSYPAGTAVSPSQANGESSVAWNVCPAWLVSESMASTSRTAKVAPEGSVTFCGGGGGAGVEGALFMASIVDGAAPTWLLGAGADEVVESTD